MDNAMGSISSTTKKKKKLELEHDKKVLGSGVRGVEER
jgi:hypothetical protein